MAKSSSKAGTPGGVVSLQSIIEQIASVTEGLEAVVDAVLASSHSVIMSIKVKAAKKRLKKSSDHITDLVHTVEECLNEIINSVDTQKLNVDIQTIVGDSNALSNLLAADPTNALKGINNKTGILGIVIGLMAIVNIIGDMNIPNPIKIRLQMLKLKKALNSVLGELPKIMEMIDENVSATDITGLQTAVIKIITIVGVVHSLSEVDTPNPIMIYLQMLKIKMMLDSVLCVLGELPQVILVIGENASVTDITGLQTAVTKIIAIIGIVQSLSDVDTPNPIKLFISMISLRLSLYVLTQAIGSINDGLNELMVVLDSAGFSGDNLDVLAKLDESLTLISLLFGVINDRLSDIKSPNPITIFFKIINLRMSLAILTSSVPHIANSLNTTQDALSNMNYDESKFAVIDDICSTVAAIARNLALIALITPLIAIAAPIAVFGVLIMGATLRAIVWSLGIIGSPASIHKANIVMRGVRRLLRRILHTIRYIAATIAMIAIIIVLCCLIGLMIPKVFGLFITGLLTIFVMMGILVGMLKIMAKLSGSAARASRAVLIRMLLVCAVMLVLALVLLVLAFISNMVNGHIMDIIIMMGLIIGVLFVMAGLMAVAGYVSPFIVAGTAAMAAIMVGILCIMLIVVLLWILTIVANYLDVPAVINAVHKVIDCVSAVVRALLEADFTGNSGEQDAGLIGNILGFIGGDLLKGIFMLFMKVVILFLALFALGIVLALVSLMLIIFDTYTKNKAKLLQTPKAVADIINICARVIQSVLNAKTGSKVGATDGMFLKLVGFVFGEDMVSIFKLLFKIVIVMLTIVVLAMIKFLCEELLWIKKFYDQNKSELAAVPQAIAEIVDVCGQVIQTVLDADTASKFKEGDGIFIALINFVNPELGTIVSLLFKIIIIALTMVVLAMLKCVMDELQWIYNAYNAMGGQAMAKNAVVMVENIIGAINSIITIISQTGKDPNGKPRSGLSKLLSWLGLDTLATIIDLLCAFAMIGLAMLALSVVMAAANMMKSCWDLYQSMGGASIGTNAYNMVKGLGAGINKVIQALADIQIKTPSNIELPWWVDAAAFIFGSWVEDVARLMCVADDLEEAVPLLTGVVGIARIMKKSELELKLAGMQMIIIKSNISKMMSNLKELVDVVNNTNIGDIDALDGNLQKIESTLVKISTRFNNLLGGKNDALLSEVIKKEATYAKVVADTDKLINRINGMDIAKVSALAKMFGNAAAFSNSINGNFDKLADVINEKIAPLIEGLTHAINEADKHIQESAKKAEEARQAAENAQRAAREARDTATANNPLSSIGSTLTNAIGKVTGDNKPGTTLGTTPAPKPNEKPAPKARKDETIGDYINRVGYLPVRIK